MTLRCSGCGGGLTATIGQDENDAHVLALARLAGFSGSAEDFWTSAFGHPDVFERVILGAAAVKSALIQSYLDHRRLERKH